MWISKERYRNLITKLRDLECAYENMENGQRYLIADDNKLRGQLATLEHQFNVLVSSLGMVYQSRPAKEEYVKGFSQAGTPNK